MFMIHCSEGKYGHRSRVFPGGRLYVGRAWAMRRQVLELAEKLTAPGNDETEGASTGSTACAATPPSASRVRVPAVEAGALAPHD